MKYDRPADLRKIGRTILSAASSRRLRVVIRLTWDGKMRSSRSEAYRLKCSHQMHSRNREDSKTFALRSRRHKTCTRWTLQITLKSYITLRCRSFRAAPSFYIHSISGHRAICNYYINEDFSSIANIEISTTLRKSHVLNEIQTIWGIVFLRIHRKTHLYFHRLRAFFFFSESFSFGDIEIFKIYVQARRVQVFPLLLCKRNKADIHVI